MKTRNILEVLVVSASVLVVSVIPVSAGPHATVVGKYLDDFARTTLLGGNITLSDSSTLIYWNAAYNGTFSIVDSVFVGKFNDGGCYRLATSTSKKYKYAIFNIKSVGAVDNADIYFRLAAQGPSDSGGISDSAKGGVSERGLDTLMGPDSLPVPAITTQFKLLVVDMAKNGLSFGLGADAVQVGTHAAMELDIDYIFMSNTNPFDTSSQVKNLFTGNSKSRASQGNVWISRSLNSIKLRTDRARLDGVLSLYDLRGKIAHRFDIHGQQSEVRIPAGSLMSKVYLYAVSGNSGAVLAKGKISIP
jgi:hypothetical protein